MNKRQLKPQCLPCETGWAGKGGDEGALPGRYDQVKEDWERTTTEKGSEKRDPVQGPKETKVWMVASSPTEDSSK